MCFYLCQIQSSGEHFYLPKSTLSLLIHVVHTQSNSCRQSFHNNLTHTGNFSSSHCLLQRWVFLFPEPYQQQHALEYLICTQRNHTMNKLLSSCSLSNYVQIFRIISSAARFDWRQVFQSVWNRANQKGFPVFKKEDPLIWSIISARWKSKTFSINTHRQSLINHMCMSDKSKTTVSAVRNWNDIWFWSSVISDCMLSLLNSCQSQSLQLETRRIH